MMMTAGGLRADLILRDATVITVDAADRIVEAVAVRDGRIVAVGSSAELDGLVGPDTRVLDLPGKTVAPGFIDSHTHNVHVGEFRYSFGQLNLAAELVPSLADLLEQVRGRAARAGPGEWIGGRPGPPSSRTSGSTTCARPAPRVSPRAVSSSATCWPTR
jgi:hypothetical protein